MWACSPIREKLREKLKGRAQAQVHRMQVPGVSGEATLVLEVHQVHRILVQSTRAILVTKKMTIPDRIHRGQTRAGNSLGWDDDEEDDDTARAKLAVESPGRTRDVLHVGLSKVLS